MLLREHDRLLKTATCEVELAFLESDGDMHFNVINPENSNSFVVHADKHAKLNIKFFHGKNNSINWKCAMEGIGSICQMFLDDGLTPRIRIVYTNEPLIILCRKIGFKKDKRAKSEYYLPKVKENN